MEIEKLPATLLLERRRLWTEMVTIRRFERGRVLAAEEGNNLLLLVEEDAAGAHLLYVYTDPEEWEGEIEMVRRFPGGDGGDAAGSGVPVGPLRPAPTRAAGEARPWPPPREEW